MDAISEALEGEKADIVVSDGAPDVTGVHDLDENLQVVINTVHEIIVYMNVCLNEENNECYLVSLFSHNCYWHLSVLY